MTAKGKIRKYSEVKRFVAERSRLKRDVFELGKVCFATLKGLLKQRIEQLAADTAEKDPRLEIKFHERNEFESGCTVAGDYILFHLHTNVFRIDADAAEDELSRHLDKFPDRAYCAVFHVYNFLADSFRFERPNDAGYLAARIFINAEREFFVEGIGGLTAAFGSFPDSVFDEAATDEVLMTVIYEALNFEMVVPEYASVAEIPLTDAVRSVGLTGQRTAKRMGFRFSDEASDRVG